MNKGWSSFMDRRVKERLVGATILVVLVVLIVPELLSGPKRVVVVPQAALPGTAEPIRSVSVDLATNKLTAAPEEEAASAAAAPAVVASAAAASVASADGAAPGVTTSTDGTPAKETAAGGNGTSVADPPAPAVSVTTLQPLQPQQPAAAAAAAPLAQHHGWAAQLGSFAARDNAEKLERQLHTQGFPAFLTATGTGKALRYRVRVGPVADRAAAEKVRARLKKAGHPAGVVAP